MSLTLKKLERFVNTRNRSEFNSNLQFQIDASSCGFKVSDLGDVKKTGDGTYYWITPHGMLVECGGRMFLSEAHANLDYNVEYVVGQAWKQANQHWER